jgi:hypothetical protein
MIGVFAHADVGNDRHLWGDVLNGTHCLLNDAVGIIVLAAHIVPNRRNAKEKYRRYAEGVYFCDLFFKLIYGKVELARHGRNLFADAVPMDEK